MTSELGTGKFTWSRLLRIAAGMALAAAVTAAQTPASSANGSLVSFTATTDNIVSGHQAIRIDVLRWSTDAERDRFAAAWNQPNPPAGRGGRGGGRGKNGPEPDLFGGGNDAVPGAAAVPPAAAGRGAAGGRAGRGGRGGDAPETPKRTPESALTEALREAPVVGHLWSPEVAGYSLHYALRLPDDGGGERIVLITDRRLGAENDLWKPSGPGAAANGPAANYEFSVLELRLNSKGEGEGKASLTGKVIFDSAAKTLSLENYGAAPVLFKSVKRRSS